MKDKAAKDAAMITTQFRTRNGMAYELKCESAKLALAVSPRESSSDADDWRVEASTRLTPGTEPVVVSAYGPTRTDALREVGRSWVESAPISGLPTVDWEAVAQALIAVRAL